MSTKAWLHSLVAAAISAAASGVAVVVVDPNTFNFTAAGLQKLGAVCGVSSLLAVAAFLKQSPLPTAEITTTTTVQATTTVEGNPKP